MNPWDRSFNNPFTGEGDKSRRPPQIQQEAPDRRQRRDQAFHNRFDMPNTMVSMPAFVPRCCGFYGLLEEEVGAATLWSDEPNI